MNNLKRLETLLEDLDLLLTQRKKTDYRSPFEFYEFCNGREYYLNDGGYSRLVFWFNSGTLHLTGNSIEPTKSRWERPGVEVLRQEIERLTQELIRSEYPEYTPE